MKQVLLDTNFIISCIKNKIDFFEELEMKGFQVIIPQQVVNEMKHILASKQKFRNKELAKLGLEILGKSKYKKIDLGKGHEDKLIIRFANSNPESVIATLDKEIQGKIKNRTITIRKSKQLDLQ